MCHRMSPLLLRELQEGLKYMQVTGRAHNARVMKDVDSDGFFALLTERVGRL